MKDFYKNGFFIKRYLNVFFRTDVEHSFWKSVLRFLWFWFFFKKRWFVLSFLLFNFFFKNTFLKKSILNKLRMYISHSFICVLGMCSVVLSFTRLNFFAIFFDRCARSPQRFFYKCKSSRRRGAATSWSVENSETEVAHGRAAGESYDWMEKAER